MGPPSRASTQVRPPDPAPDVDARDDAERDRGRVAAEPVRGDGVDPERRDDPRADEREEQTTINPASGSRRVVGRGGLDCCARATSASAETSRPAQPVLIARTSSATPNTNLIVCAGRRASSRDGEAARCCPRRSVPRRRAAACRAAGGGETHRSPRRRKVRIARIGYAIEKVASQVEALGEVATPPSDTNATGRHIVDGCVA